MVHSCFNALMDISDIRRKNLSKLVQENGLSTVAKRAGKPDRQINDMICGRKSFGEKVARAIEAAYDPSKPSGWLDRNHESSDDKKEQETAFKAKLIESGKSEAEKKIGEAYASASEAKKMAVRAILLGESADWITSTPIIAATIMGVVQYAQDWLDKQNKTEKTRSA